MTKCTLCALAKHEDSFYHFKGKRHGNRCRDCVRLKHKERYAADPMRYRAKGFEARNRIAAIKLAMGCTECGYNKHAVALDFDHRPGTVKVRNVSSMINQSWALIEAEIAKCDLVCANCHRVRTAERLSI